MKKFFCFVFFLIATNVCNAQWFVNGANNNYWDSSNVYFDKSTYNENNPYKDWKMLEKKNNLKYNVNIYNYKNNQNKFNYIIVVPYINNNSIFR